MIPRITRIALIFTGLAAPLAHAQVSMKMGDLVLFDSTEDAPIRHYNRDNGVVTPIATPRTDDDGTTFQSNGEIEQGPDGGIYIADLPYSHTVKVDTHYGADEGGAVTIYRPTGSSTFTIIPDNLAISSDNSSLRVAYSGTQGAVLKHHLDTGALETLSSGNLLTGDIAAASVTPEGNILVAQAGATGNLVLVDGTTHAQTLVGASTQLNGPVYDVEPLTGGFKAAIATGGNGVVIATYRFNSLTSKYETTFQNIGNFGGSAQWVKTDTDGNLLVSVYFTPTSSKIMKYDLASARIDTVLTLPRLTSFGVIRQAVTVPSRASLSTPSSSALQLSFSGLLQSSTDLVNWAAVDPQPTSPFTITGNKAREFFRVTDADPHPMQGNILFRGNSYTLGDFTTGPTNLPNMVKAIAGSLNYNFGVDMFAIGGYSFKNHYEDANSLAYVQKGHWHDAVLQNFSTDPTTAGSPPDHLKYGRLLYLQQIAQDPKVNVYLYETPAYRANQTDTYPSKFASPDVFQSQLTLNYRQLAQNLNTEFPNNPHVQVVPTGELVQVAGGLLPVTNRFFVQMHADDGQHMSDNRLAMTGLAFFVALTHQNPAGLLSTPTVQALGLNITADKAWLEKLVWRYMTTGAYPLAIIDEPQAQAAVVDAVATFSTRVQGSGPISYQWYKDGTAIPGATASSVLIPGTGAASNAIHCVITNSEGSVQTNDVALTNAADVPGLIADVDFNYPGFETLKNSNSGNDPTNVWNNWGPTSTTDFTGLPSSIALQRIDGTPSGITLQSTILGTGAGPNGVAGISPTNATVDYWYGDNNHPVIEFKATGLKTAKTYKLVFYASRRTDGQTADNRETSFKVTGSNTQTQTLNAFNNAGNAATITGVKPDADGNIVIHVNKGAANTNTNGYFYLNLMQINLE